jgi:hypothetical protein
MLPRPLAHHLVFYGAFVVFRGFESQRAVAQILFDEGYDKFS